MADLASRIIGAESNGDPYARNSRSSAGGAGQFIDSTWLSTVKKHRPDVAQGKSDAQLLQLKFDPNLSKEMTAAYASDNASYLRSRGAPADDTALSLAHFAGPKGAAALYASPDASAESVLGAAAMEANPFLRGKKASDVINWAGKRVAGGSAPSVSSMMARALKEKVAPQGATGAVAQDRSMNGARQAASPAAGGRSFDPDTLKSHDDLISSGRKIAGTSGNAIGAIGGTLLAGYGAYERDRATEGKAADEGKLIEAAKASGVEVPPMIEAFLGSKNPEYRQAGLDALMKLQGPKASPAITTVKSLHPVTGQEVETQVIPDGRGGWKPFSLDGNAAPAPVAPGGNPVPQTIAPQEPVGAPPAAVPAAVPAAPEMIQMGPGPAELAAQQQRTLPPQDGQPVVGAPVLNSGKQDMPAAPAPLPQLAPAAPAPSPAEVIASKYGPNVFVGPGPATKEKLGEGNVQIAGPNGEPLYRRLPNGGSEPLREPKAVADARGKAIGEAGAAEALTPKVAEQFAGALEQFQRAPAEFGKEALERSIGPWRASTSANENSVGGAISAALTFVPQQMARFNGEAERYLQGGAAPTEVRDNIETTAKNMAAIMKPLVRKPGEGVWTDKDQENLEKQLGGVSRARTLEEYTRRVEAIRENVSRIFKIPVRDTQSPGRTPNAPATAEAEETAWERYRKQAIGY